MSNGGGGGGTPHVLKTGLQTHYSTLANPCMLVCASELATCEMTRLMLPTDSSVLLETEGIL